MTKSNRAKKAKKADFTKVKIKLGKKIKKAQNETKVDFKVRKIILKEQLANKDASGQLLTKKKHTVKELLLRLGHQTACVRQDGLDGLKELLGQQEPRALVPYLSALVPRLSFCILDLDTKIRSAAVKVIELLLVKLKEEMDFYFEPIVSHLACAMVHMNIGIQGDSLNLVSLLITHNPKMISRYADSLLANFIDLVSRKVYNEQNKIFDVSRSLLVSPDNKLTSLKWRIKLWQELARFLQAILKERTMVENSTPISLLEGIMEACKPRDNSGGTCDMNQLQILNDANKFNTFLLSLLPLLFQTMAEINPQSSKQKSTDSGLSQEGMQALRAILDLLSLLYDISKFRMDDQPEKFSTFRHVTLPLFRKHLLDGFPYFGHKPDKSKKGKNTDLDIRTNCHDINLMICYIGFVLNTDGVKLSQDDQRILNYISELLDDSENDSKYSMSTLTDVVVDVVQKFSSTEFYKIDSILSSCFECFCRLHPLKRDRQTLLTVLLEVTHIRNRNLWSSEVIGKWCHFVIDTLASDDVTETLYRCALTLRQRNSQGVKKCWSDNEIRIQENLKLQKDKLAHVKFK